MNVTKLGHCCLLLEESGVRILTDPGILSTAQNDLKNIDIVLITHEHSDHLHVESLVEVLSHNPHATVITNTAVHKILHEKQIAAKIITEGMHTQIKGISFEGFGTQHAEMHHSMPRVENTGYLIHNHLFYPGDAFTVPTKPVRVLALPVAGPWMKISEAIEYALTVKPHVCFPVHDGVLAAQIRSRMGMFPASVLGTSGIKMVPLDDGHSIDV